MHSFIKSFQRADLKVETKKNMIENLKRRTNFAKREGMGTSDKGQIPQTREFRRASEASPNPFIKKYYY
jgi:hypothetical protein